MTVSKHTFQPKVQDPLFCAECDLPYDEYNVHPRAMTSAEQTEEALRVAVEALTAAQKELEDVRKNRCTCLHDYFDGDHHCKWCPGNDAAKKASIQLWISHNRIGYQLEQALAHPAIASLRKGTGRLSGNDFDYPGTR